MLLLAIAPLVLAPAPQDTDPLAADPFLATLALVDAVDVPDGGGRILWQEPESSPTVALRNAIEALPAWFAAQDRWLEAWLDEPAGAAPDLVLLAGRGQLGEALAGQASFGGQVSWARYASAPNAVMSHLGIPDDELERWRGIVLSERARARLEAAIDPDARGREVRWIIDGLSLVLAGGGAEPPTEVEALTPPRDRMLFAFHNLNDREVASRWWLDMERVLGVRGAADVARIAVELGGVDASLGLREYVAYEFASQAALLVSWLRGREGGDAALRAHLASALSGAGETTALAEAFGFADPAALVRAFYEELPEHFLLSLRRRIRPIDPDDPTGAAALAKLEEESRAAMEAHAAEFAKALAENPGAEPESAEPPPPTFVVAAPEERHAYALGLVRAGRFDRAADVLREALESAGEESQWSAFFARELERVESLDILRAAIVRDAVERGRKLRFAIGDEVLAIETSGEDEAGIAIVPSPRHGLERVAWESWTPSQLALNLSRNDFDQPVGAAYAKLLAGEERWARGLDAEVERALDADAPDIRARGPAGDMLTRLADLEATPSAAPEEASARIEGLTELSLDDEPLLEPQRELWRHLVERELRLVSSGLEPEDLVRVPLERMPDGRVRVVYEFDDPRELDDWRTAHGFMGGTPENAGFEAHEPYATQIQDGTLLCDGHTRIRWSLGLLPPLEGSLAYRIQIGSDESAKTFFGLNLCAKDAGTYVAVSGGRSLVAYDVEAELSLRESIPDLALQFFGPLYELSFEHTGSRMELSRPDGAAITLDAPEVRGSGVVWLVYTVNRVELERLELVGTLDPEAVDAARRRWFAERLAKLVE